MSDRPDTEPGETPRPDERTGGEDIEIPVRPETQPETEPAEAPETEAPSGGERRADAVSSAEEQPLREEAAESIDISELGEDDIKEAVQKAGERDKLYDKFLRARAELENFRKRALREQETVRDIAVMDLVRLVLPVLDNFDRALDSASDHKKFKAFHKGIALIEQQLYKALEEGGVERIKAVGKHFDPNFHEAVTMEDNKDRPDGTVLEELQKGYVYRGRVLRPAKVRISRKP